MKTINEYIEQAYIDELNIIEESIFDDEEEQLEKVEKDLQKQLKIVAKSDKMDDKDFGQMLHAKEIGSHGVDGGCP